MDEQLMIVKPVKLLQWPEYVQAWEDGLIPAHNQYDRGTFDKMVKIKDDTVCKHIVFEIKWPAKIPEADRDLSKYFIDVDKDGEYRMSNGEHEMIRIPTEKAAKNKDYQPKHGEKQEFKDGRGSGHFPVWYKEASNNYPNYGKKAKPANATPAALWRQC